MPEFQPRENLTDLTVETVLGSNIDDVAFAMAQNLSPGQLYDWIAQLEEQLEILQQAGATPEETSDTRANLHSAYVALQLNSDINNFGA